MRNWTILALAATMAIGCSDDDGMLPIFDGGGHDTSGGGTDSGPEPDAGPGMDAGPGSDAGPMGFDGGDGPSCTFEGPYGALVGATMRPVPTVAQGGTFELQDCDGNGFAFPDQATCDAKLTILSIAAGWCGPCLLESANFERVINQGYAPEDVRLIQIIIQDEDGNVPPPNYCNNWVSRFGLTNTELVDEAQLLQAFFPDNSLPSTVIINNQGEILSRENGISDESLSSLTIRIDALLQDMM